VNQNVLIHVYFTVVKSPTYKRLLQSELHSSSQLSSTVYTKIQEQLRKVKGSQLEGSFEHFNALSEAVGLGLANSSFCSSCKKGCLDVSSCGTTHFASV